MEKEKNPDNLPKTEIIDGKEVIKDSYQLGSGDIIEIFSNRENGKIINKIIHTPLGNFTTNQEAIDKLAMELNFKSEEVEGMIDDMLKDWYLGKINEKGKIKPSEEGSVGVMSFFTKKTKKDLN